MILASFDTWAHVAVFLATSTLMKTVNAQSERVQQSFLFNQHRRKDDVGSCVGRVVPDACDVFFSRNSTLFNTGNPSPSPNEFRGSDLCHLLSFSKLHQSCEFEKYTVGDFCRTGSVFQDYDGWPEFFAASLFPFECDREAFAFSRPSSIPALHSWLFIKIYFQSHSNAVLIFEIKKFIRGDSMARLIPDS